MMTPAECAARVAEGHARWLGTADVQGFGELLSMLLLVALLLAVVLAPLCQWAYSRRMQRLMGLTEVADAPPAWWRRRGQRLRAPGSVGRDASLTIADAMVRRERRIRQATWVSYSVFVAGGLALLPFQTDEDAFNAFTMVAVVSLLALGPAVVNIRPYGSKHWLLAAPAAAMVLAAATDTSFDAEEFFYTGVVLLCLHLASVHRTMRSLIVPLLVLCAGFGFGIALASWLGVPVEQCLSLRFGDDPSTAASTVMFVVAATAIVLGVWLALLALERLERLVEHGWLSDISLVAGAGFASVAALLMLQADDPRTGAPTVALLYAGWLGLSLAAYVAALALQPCPQMARSLLMLRVFSRDARAERLLDALQSRWRLAGPVLEIGGPDLAKLNLDLHEFIMFVTLRLHELLHPRGVPQAEFIASLDLAADREGRFRVDEVFCFDSSWHAMVERLIGLSDAVLLDLRGFDVKRAGTTHELVRLAALGRLGQVVAVHDAHTDWAHVERTVAAVGASASALRVRVDAADAQALDRCLSELLKIADPRDQKSRS
jgi:hypothetical protein